MPPVYAITAGQTTVLFYIILSEMTIPIFVIIGCENAYANQNTVPSKRPQGK